MASASTLTPSSGIEVLEAHARALGTLTDATPRVGYAPARKSGAQVHEMPHTHRGNKSPGRGQLHKSASNETLQAAAMTAAAEAVLGSSGSNLIAAVGAHGDVPSARHLNVGDMQRIDAPRELHAPARFPMPQAKMPFAQQPGSSSPNKAPSPKKPGKFGHIYSKIKDYEVRAAACLRAGRSREQGDALFCMALLHDNLDNREQANALYIKYYNMCVQLKLVSGQALALNSLGINKFLSGDLQLANEMFQRHLEIADVPGKFVAHTNLGLVEAAAGNYSAAAVNHRLALRCAIILRSIEGEALACGNLGVASSAGGDTDTARQCMQRYLKLSATLHDPSAQARAQEGLGKLAAAEGLHSEARQCFESARELTRCISHGTGGRAGDSGAPSAAETKMEVAMARGNEVFDELLAKAAADMERALQLDDD